MTYKIIRFRQNASQKIIKTGLSLEEAKLWCSRDDTKGKNWFDGFTKEKNVVPS